MAIRLLVVSPSMARGGAQRFGATLLAHLDRNKFSPELALVRDDIDFDIPRDVPVHKLGYRGPLTAPFVVRRLSRLIDESRPELLLSTLISSGLATGMALSLARHRPAWVVRFGNDSERHDPPLLRLLNRRFLKEADQFVINAEALRSGTYELYPFTRGRTERIGNPVDFSAADTVQSPSARHSPPPGPVLLCVARFDQQKGHSLLLEALVRVRARVDAQLWLAGNGPLEAELHARVAELNLTPYVKFLGFVPKPFDLMRQATLFVLASEHEGLPNALLEAQGLGLPAVVTRTGSVEAILEGESGLVVPYGDAEVMANAILSLLEDDARRERFSARAREQARERFSSECIVPCWQALLEAAAKLR